MNDSLKGKILTPHRSTNNIGYLDHYRKQQLLKQQSAPTFPTDGFHTISSLNKIRHPIASPRSESPFMKKKAFSTYMRSMTPTRSSTPPRSASPARFSSPQLYSKRAGSPLYRLSPKRASTPGRVSMNRTSSPSYMRPTESTLSKFSYSPSSARDVFRPSTPLLGRPTAELSPKRNSPGPKYDIEKSFKYIEPKSPAYTFGHRPESPSYLPKHPSRASSLVTSKSIKSFPSEVPGPGQYNLGSTLGGPKYSFARSQDLEFYLASRRRGKDGFYISKETRNQKFPSPGQYDIKSTIGREGPSFSFGSSRGKLINVPQKEESTKPTIVNIKETTNDQPQKIEPPKQRDREQILARLAKLLKE